MFFINKPKFPSNKEFKKTTEILQDNMSVDKDYISVFKYEPHAEVTLYHGTPYDNIEKILSTGYKDTEIFGKLDIDKVISYMLDKSFTHEYGGIMEYKCVGGLPEPIWGESYSIPIDKCYLSAIYKVKINLEMPTLRRSSGITRKRKFEQDDDDDDDILKKLGMGKNVSRKHKKRKHKKRSHKKRSHKKRSHKKRSHKR